MMKSVVSVTRGVSVHRSLARPSVSVGDTSYCDCSIDCVDDFRKRHKSPLYLQQRAWLRQINCSAGVYCVRLFFVCGNLLQRNNKTTHQFSLLKPPSFVRSLIHSFGKYELFYCGHFEFRRCPGASLSQNAIRGGLSGTTFFR